MFIQILSMKIFINSHKVIKTRLMFCFALKLTTFRFYCTCESVQTNKQATILHKFQK